MYTKKSSNHPPSNQGETKAPGALRTIGEVSEELSIEPHILRYWEDRFPELKPVKRAGGRRLYRPEDVALARGLRYFLRERRLTIEGARKALKEEGIEAVRRASPTRMDRKSWQTLLKIRGALLQVRKELSKAE